MMIHKSVDLQIYDLLFEAFNAYRIPNLIRFSVEFWTNIYCNRQSLRIYIVVKVFGFKILT